jgi:2-amino-4-hydroxy-6-hydroxymethyldihydropteridine diphosphokinase
MWPYEWNGMPAVPEVRRAALALGSNIGDSAGTLQGAVDALHATPGIEVVAVSAVFETDPVGGPDQDVFLNAVVMVETSLEPSRLNSISAACATCDGGRAHSTSTCWPWLIW